MRQQHDSQVFPNTVLSNGVRQCIEYDNNYIPQQVECIQGLQGYFIGKAISIVHYINNLKNCHCTN